MWMTLLKILCLALTTSCLPSHVCSPKGQGWTEMVITPGVDSRAGFMQTQGFPRDIPKTPFRCRWIINNTEMYAIHQNWKKNSKNLIRSGDESWILYIYFTQLYIKEEMVTVRECYDFNCNNVTVEFNKKIDDKKGLFNTQQTAVWSWLPFVHIELEVLDRRGAHMRVMEVNDAYGLNITWAVAKEHRSQAFFSCSLVECSFNGECLAYADHNDNALGSMGCHCSSPAGVDHVNTFNTPFYGDKCQFHNKHGYCTGPGDGHADAKQRD